MEAIGANSATGSSPAGSKNTAGGADSAGKPIGAGGAPPMLSGFQDGSALARALVGCWVALKKCFLISAEGNCE